MGFFKNISKAYKQLAEGPVQSQGRGHEYGRPGTSVFSGFITEDFNSDFHGQKGILIYEKMRKTDATVSSVLRALKLPLLAAEKSIESANPDDELQNEIAEFVRSNLFDRLEGGFSSFYREALGHLEFGFYYFEKVWEIRDGMVYLKKLAPRLPSAHMSWEMKTTKEKGVTQMLKGYDGTVGPNPEIPMDKLVLFTNEKEGDNYEGVSILRAAYKHWYFKDNLYRIDGIRLERGAGILSIGLPDGANDDDRTDAEEMGENFKLNEQAYILKPSKEWQVELMTAGISDQAGKLTDSVNHHDRMITLNVLAQFLALGSGETGSYALSQDQSSFFTLGLRAVADYTSTVINEQAIKDMVNLNFGEQDAYPKLKVGEIGQPDFGEMATVVKQLFDMGLVEASPEMKAWAHKTFKLPNLTVANIRSEEDEELDNMLGDLAILEAEIAGMPEAQDPQEEKPVEQMTDDELVAKAEAMPEEEKAAVGLSEMSFGTKGEPLSDETKKKISEALKKGGTAKEGTLTNKFQKDGEISMRTNNIADAKRRIVELRTVITAFRETSKAMTDRNAKKAFNASIKAKVEEVRVMIAAGLMGIKNERGAIEERKDVVREEHNTDKAMERETKAREKMQAKAERIHEKMEAIKQSISKAKTREARERAQNRLEEMESEHTELEDMLRSAQPISLAERRFFRELTLAETRVKFAEVDDFFTDMEQDVMDRLRVASDEQREALLREAEKIIDAKDVGAIFLLSLGMIDGLSSDIKGLAKKALEEGKRTAANEINSSLPTTPSVRGKIINTRVDLLLEERASEILGTMKKRILDVIQKEIGKTQAVHELAKSYDDISEWWNTQITGRIVVDSFDDGRDLVFDTYRSQVHGLQRSEILDMKTCPMCLSMDGRVISPTDPFSRIGQIHTNCRGIWVAVLKTDSELPKVKPLPKSLTSRFDTIEGVPNVNDFTQLKKPIIGKTSRAGQMIIEEQLDNPNV